MRFGKPLEARQAEFKARLLSREVKGIRRTSHHGARCLVHAVLRQPLPSNPNKRVCKLCRSEAVKRHRTRAKADIERQYRESERRSFVRIDQYLEAQRKVIEMRRVTSIASPQCPLKLVA